LCDLASLSSSLLRVSDFLSQTRCLGKCIVEPSIQQLLSLQVSTERIDAMSEREHLLLELVRVASLLFELLSSCKLSRRAIISLLLESGSSLVRLFEQLFEMLNHSLLSCRAKQPIQSVIKLNQARAKRRSDAKVTNLEPDQPSC